MDYTPEQVEALNEAAEAFTRRYQDELNRTKAFHAVPDDHFYQDVEKALAEWQMSVLSVDGNSRATKADKESLRVHRIASEEWRKIRARILGTSTE